MVFLIIFDFTKITASSPGIFTKRKDGPWPSDSQKREMVIKEGFIDRMDVRISLFQKEPDEHIGLAGWGKAISSRHEEIVRFLRIQPQGNGEGQSRGFLRFVVDIGPDFRKQLSVDVRPFVGRRIAEPLFIDEPEQRLGKGFFQLVQTIFQGQKLRTLPPRTGAAGRIPAGHRGEHRCLR